MRAATDDGVRAPTERRRRPRFLYTRDQLLGRAPIYTRRRSDKWQLGFHLVTAAALVVLTAWWVLPLHPFAGPVLVDLAPGRGVHAGDLPSLVFLAVAARSVLAAASRRH